MHMDYRFYVKFRNEDIWRNWLETVAIEATDGEEYNLLEISKVFNSSRGIMRMMETIGMIFETVTAVEDEAFCFIHDYKKSQDFFTRLTDYLFEEVIKIAEDDAIVIADLTDFDTNMMGDHIRYYLGGGVDTIRKCVVEGPEGLEHHDIELSNILEMLKYENLTAAQKEKIQDITGGSFPTDLMEPMGRSSRNRSTN